jgi:hypothetical protein
MFQVIEIKAVPIPNHPNEASQLEEKVMKTCSKHGQAVELRDKLNRAQDLEIENLVSYIIRPK